MRLVITGGAGFVGSHLCEYYLAQGHEIICLDNLITGDLKNIKHLMSSSSTALTTSKRFKFINHNVSQYIQIDGEVDAILHFASPASPKDYLEYPIQTLKAGSLGTHNALGFAKAKGAKFLLASTSEVYGDPQVHPQPESYWGNVNPVGPRGVYDESKRFAEALTMAYHQIHQLDTKIARIFNTYGPRMRLNDGRALPSFIPQALKDEDLTVFGDGSQTRSFCYVSDLVDGITRLLNSQEHLPVNLGNPTEISINKLVQEIIALTGSRSKIKNYPLPEDDPKMRKPDISKAQRVLDWQPKVSRTDGLKETIAYFRQALNRSGSGQALES